MADSTLSNLTSLTLPSQATDLLLVGRGTARPNKVAMSDALNSAALAATTGAYGVVQLAASGGTTAGTVVQATDARLSDTRNPPDGSKGDIIVSGSGSTWTIKTNPTFKGIATVATTGGVATHVLEYTGGNSLFTGYNATNSVFAQNGGASMTLSNSVTIAAAGSNQPITLTPSGAATAGGLSLSRLTSTNQTLALLNYGTDELMSIAGTGYTGVGSRSNTGFLLYSNNIERARFLAGGNFLIAKTIDNALGRLQVNGAITMEETAGTGLFGFFGGSSLVYGSLASNPVVIRTNNTAALTLDTSQNATFAKDILLGTSGPSVPSTLSARAPRQGLVFDGSAGQYAGTTISALGTSPLTYEAVFRVPSAVGTGQGIMYVGTSAASVGGNSGAVYIQSSGELRVIFRTDNSNYSIADLSSFVTNNADKFVHFAFVRPSSGNPSVYINGVAQSPAFSVGGSPAGGWQMNLTGTNAVLNTIDGSATAGTTILSPRIYNRAFTAAEVKALYETGVPAASEFWSGNLNANVGDPSTITLVNATITSSNSTSVTGASLGTSNGQLNIGAGFTARAGQKVRLTFSVTGVNQPSLLYVRWVATGVEGWVTLAQVGITGSSGTFTYDFTTVISGSNFFQIRNFDAAAPQNIDITNWSARAVGVALAPDAAQTGGGLTWYDTSGNGANITLPASGVSWNVPWSGSLTPSGAATPVLIKKTQAYLEINSDDIRRGRFGTDGSNSVSVGSLTNHPLEFFVNSVSAGRFAATSRNLLINGTNDTNNYRVKVYGASTSVVEGLGIYNSTPYAAGSPAESRVSLGRLESSTLQEMGAIGARPTFDTSSANGSLLFYARTSAALAQVGLWNYTGNLLIGPSGTTDSNNGRLQLATHTAATGGIGFGTDTALYRANAGQLYLDAPASTSGAFWVNAGAGNTSASLNLYPQGTGVAQVSAVGAASLVLRTNNATALSLDSSQNANLAGSYFFIGGAGSNFYIRSTGADNGLIRGNNVSVDCASDFLFRNGAGTTEYARVVGSLGTFLLGTATNSFNGRLQLATHTASSGGIGFGTDVVLYRQTADVLKTDDCFVVSGTGLPNTTHGLELQHNGTTGYVFSYNRGTSTPLAIAINHTGGNVELAASGSHQVLVKGTGVSNSTSSGALVVSGGLGVAGAAFFGGNIQCNAAFAANNTTLYLRPQGATISAGQLEVATTGNVTINGNLTVTGTISPSGGGGSTNVWIPASQWIPRTTNGCGVDSTQTTTNLQNFDELLFDPATAEYAQALVRMPSNYNNGTVTARFFWSSSSSTGSVVWGLQARAFADDDALDTAFGTAQTVTDTLLATGDMHISAATSAVTSGGTPAATTPLQFQIYRDATNGSDTLGSDARLLGVEISFTSV